MWTDWHTQQEKMKQHPEESNIIVKSKPTVQFKTANPIFYEPNKYVSFVGSLHKHWKRTIYCPVLLYFFARVNAMEEDPGLPKEERARQIHSSLHSTPQRSHHWLVITACKGNIYFVSAVNTRRYKDPFYLLLLITMKKKIVLLKAPFFSASTNESVFSAIFQASQACACPVWPSPAKMNAAVLHSVHTNGSTYRILNVLRRLCVVATLALYIAVVSTAPLAVVFQERVPGDSATNWGKLELQNKHEVTKNLFKVC